LPISQYINHGDLIWAHTNTAYRAETLIEHSDLTLHFFQQLIKENGLEKVLNRVIEALRFQGRPLAIKERNLVKKWFEQAIYLHDIGKINPSFQRIKMKNTQLSLKTEKLTSDTNHSLFSSLLYLDIFTSDIESIADEELQMYMGHLLFYFAYTISRHHTYLQDQTSKGKETFIHSLKNQLNKVKRQPIFLQYYRFADRLSHEFNLEFYEAILEYGSSSENEPFSFYILVKLLYSTLVACDFYATYTYENNGVKPDFRFLHPEDISVLRKCYSKTDVVQGIQNFQKDPAFFEEQPINALRSKIYLDAEKNLLKNSHQNLFYLEAPTGSGKTNTSINLALHLLEQDAQLNKIMYVFPFNTLIEQTKESLDKVFDQQLQEKYRISVVNSVTPICRKLEEKEGEADIDYKEEVLLRQMLQYPLTVTSHVNFFNYLFGTGRESNLALTHLCNSVIILDEIQSYRNAIWVEVIRFLHKFSSLLNMKIIIMSATLPKLDRLLDSFLEEKEITAELLPNAEDYYNHPLFKERVKLNYELLRQGTTSLDTLLDKVMEIREERITQQKGSRILIEFIDKANARAFYNKLSLVGQDLVIIELTGDDHSYYRKKVLSDLKEMEPTGEYKLRDCIVVATQVIEAGVDIDMDIGFKHISILDGEEQFLGRINRSCLRSDCYTYFFYLKDPASVYKEDFRLEKDLREEFFQILLSEKRYDDFYQLVFQRLLERRQERNANHIQHFLSRVRDLDFSTIAEHMKLIEDNTYTLFINYTFQFDDGTCLEGAKVWSEYTELLTNKELDYAKRKVELSMIQEKMSYFTFSTYTEPKRFDNDLKRTGNIYYVENGKPYLVEDPYTGMLKFSFTKYQEESESMFI